MSQRPRRLLWAAILVPCLYFGNLMPAGLFYPGYNHRTQQPSELGASGAPHPAIFNVGAVMTGLAVLVAGLGFFRAISDPGGRRIPGFLLGFVLTLAGFYLIALGVFPLPDPRHGAYSLGLAIHFAPFLLAAALWNRPDLHALDLWI